MDWQMVVKARVASWVRLVVSAAVVLMSQAALAQVGTPVVASGDCVEGANCGWYQRLWGYGGMVGLALVVGLIVAAGFVAAFAMRAFRRDSGRSHPHAPPG